MIEIGYEAYSRAQGVYLHLRDNWYSVGRLFPDSIYKLQCLLLGMNRTSTAPSGASKLALAKTAF